MRKILVLLFSCPYLGMRQQKHNIKNIKHLFQKILNMFMCKAHTPLSIGEGLGVRSLLILLLLCPYMSMAQYKPLTIGSTLPPMQFDSVVNFSNTTLCTDDLKGKLVVLDFFATWCGSCRKNIPILDSLQRKYKDRLQVVLVSCSNTKDDITRTKAFYSRLSATGHNISMPAIVQDSVLMQLFPFTTIPHYVWLDDQLTVKAITSSAFITEENIIKMLSLIKPSPNPNSH